VEAPIALPDPPPTDGAVTLRPWAESDLPELVRCFADPTISQWLPMIPYPYAEADARKWFATLAPRREAGTGAGLAIVDAMSGKLLGGVGFRPDDERRAEVGYWVRRERRGEGIATRALRLLSAWAIAELGFARIQLHCDVENVASQRVAEKAGYTREGVLRAWLEVDGEPRDHVLYSALASEWRTQTFGS
jgi:RimJ/RimL family protein N-acetyltransferase